MAKKEDKKDGELVVEFGEEAAFWVRALITRGFEASASDGKVTTNAPKDIVDTMVSGFRSRLSAKK